MSSGITYRSYAKINLYLHVLNRRRDGFHNIETIFQSVSLYDELEFAEAPSRVTLTCSARDLDTGEGNLVHRAATLLRERAGISAGARIHLEKRIPIAAGLAGGSGNAAATLVALNTLWGLRRGTEELRALAAELGSDVPYCTMGGTAAATGRGEVLSPLAPLKETWFVLLHPGLAVSAARTYNHPLLPRDRAPRSGCRTTRFREAIRMLEEGEIAGLIHNSMETPVFHDFPSLARAREQLLEAGCAAAAMSGSGPTLFGLCPSRQEALRVAGAISGFETSVVHTVPTGVERFR